MKNSVENTGWDFWLCVLCALIYFILAMFFPYAVIGGDDSDGSVNLTLGDAVNVDGVDCNEHYNVLSHARDAWISTRKS